MSYFNAVIENKAAFEQALDTPLPVFALFASETCHACTMTLPWFVQITETYQGKIKVLIINSAESPKHPNVLRIPTLLIYQQGQLVATLEGVSESALFQALIDFA